MTRILLTAFEPYEPWVTNASWLALIELTKKLDYDAELTTRLYPAELEATKARLAKDVKANYDFVFHVGQAPNSCCIQLEELAINVTTGKSSSFPYESLPICASGEQAYRSQLPLAQLALGLREAGIPTRVSYHAGTHLSNGILYWSRRLSHDLDLPTRSTFIHIPLDTSQVIDLEEPVPFMPKQLVADGLSRLIGLVASDAPETVEQVD